MIKFENVASQALTDNNFLILVGSMNGRYSIWLIDMVRGEVAYKNFACLDVSAVLNWQKHVSNESQKQAT